MITLNEIIKKYGIDKLNSLTKYPSILTYHDLGEKGSLKPSLVENKSFKNENNVYLTEKIDGTNSRIVFWNNDFLIGSRENFLYAKGDRFGDSTLNIVNTIKDIANKISDSIDNNYIYILYGETYGGNVTSASKNYTCDKSYNFRMFDVVIIPIETAVQILTKPIEEISSWREHGGQCFLTVDDIKLFSEKYNIITVPYIKIINGKETPLDLKSTYEWLQEFSITKAGINNTGKTEGVVVRNFNRSLIRKIRFEDYERTQKRGGF